VIKYSAIQTQRRNAKMPALTQEDLQIRSAVPVSDIHKFYIKIDKNTHAVFHMEGTISEEEGKDVILQPLSGTTVMISASSQTLFVGILRDIQITHEGACYHVSLTGISSTDKLDHEKKNRSFQDTFMTYREVMQQVIADTPGTKLWFQGIDRTIQKPLYQIDETDWSFLKRLASRLHTVLVPSVNSAAACVHIGKPKGNINKADSQTVCEKIWSDRKSQGISRRIRTSQNWEIGDKIEWEGYRYTISLKECRLEKGLLQFYYTFADDTAFEAEENENLYLTGLMLPATVLDVKEEQVKVKFDMDFIQPLESAYWYPWQPEVGNLAYCMPEKGERVYIHIGNAAGGEDRAVCGVRRNGTGNSELKNSHRYFTTKDKKRLYLEPDAIGFRDMKQKKLLQLKLSDTAGANVTSHRSLALVAKGTIGLKGGSILFQAPKEISLVKRAVSPTVINMCNGFDTVGAADTVMMKGESGDDFPVFFRSGEQDGQEPAITDRKTAQKSIIGSTPTMELTDNLEKQLEGCQVKCLGTGKGDA